MSRIVVLGAGAFGTALAVAYAKAGHEVALWCRDEARARDMATMRENRARLPGIALPDGIAVTSTLETEAASAVLLAVPAQALRGVLHEMRGALDGHVVVSLAKGIDLATSKRPSQVVGEACPATRVAVLTGPSFAADIARGLPTALTLATQDFDAEHIQSLLSTPTLRPYRTADIVGAELGGALKNVIALAAGLTIGAGLGESARAAVITRGFAEIVRFALSEGAAAATLSGLSGLGDLTLTATSERSRNYAAGLALGSGRDLPVGSTIEGLATAEAMAEIARRRGMEMPLSTTVADVTHGRLSVRDAARHLMARPLKEE